MTNEELILSYQQGNKKALDELIENNKGIVYTIANKFYIACNNIIEKEDLIQEGFTGLIIAVEKYDPNNDKKAAFITYAVAWIYNKIYKLVCGTSSREQGNNTLNNKCTSLNVLTGENEDTELIDYIEGVDYSFENIEDKICNEQLHEELEQVMNETLTLKEREVIKLFFGWGGIQPMQLNEIDALLNVKAALEKSKALNKIRKTSWARKKIDEHLEEKIFTLRNKSFVKERDIDTLIIL